MRFLDWCLVTATILSSLTHIVAWTGMRRQHRWSVAQDARIERLTQLVRDS